MDIEKLKSIEAEINAQAKKEIYDDLSDAVLNFLTDPIIDHGLNQVKIKNNSATSARILNNWIEQGIVKVDSNDKGKTNRFSKEESLWLLLVTELRNFGVSLDKIKLVRYELFNELFPSFTFFRFSIIRTIFDSDQTLIVFSDGTTKLMSSAIYNKWIHKTVFPPHINININGIISTLFPKNSFDLKIENEKFFDNSNNLKILYFLKTGDFDNINVEIKKGDIRLIKETGQLIKNQELLELITEGSYIKIEVDSNGKTFTINK